MKKIFYLILLSTLIVVIFIIYNNKFLNKKVEIDFLDEALEKIKNDKKISTQIYYINNNDSIDLYYKTQFCLAPHIIIKSEFSKMKKENYFLILERSVNKYSISDSIELNSLFLYSDSTKYFKYKLFKKK